MEQLIHNWLSGFVCILQSKKIKENPGEWLFICVYFYMSAFSKVIFKKSREYSVIAAKSKPITTRKQNGWWKMIEVKEQGQESPRRRRRAEKWEEVWKAEEVQPSKKTPWVIKDFEKEQIRKEGWKRKEGNRGETGDEWLEKERTGMSEENDEEMTNELQRMKMEGDGLRREGTRKGVKEGYPLFIHAERGCCDKLRVI